MLKFEEYLSDFTNTVSIADFVIGILVAATLSVILKRFYISFATSVSNREKFASNFLPLALTTMLIITVVQASIALSLGLVGALSIVRFRAAIKEPEELTYLFLTIGIGLVCGANKPILAIIAIAVILPLIYLNRIFSQKHASGKNMMYLNIKTDKNSIAELTQIIEKELNYIEVKRIEQGQDKLFASYNIKADGIAKINSLIKTVKAWDSQAEISILDLPDIAL